MAKIMRFILIPSNLFDLEFFVFKVNKLLPRDIVIHSVEGVDESFHARFSATSRRYIYRIHTNKDPFISQFSWHFDRIKPDSIGIMNETAQFLIGLSDFASFAKTGSDNKTTLCNLIQCEWHSYGTRVELHIEANRFLRGMVRLIVGGCVNIAVGKLEMELMKNLVLRRSDVTLCFFGTRPRIDLRGSTILDISNLWTIAIPLITFK
jgi:tRNA pseudouridine38-40 synthase